ncbi:CCA tRNA nucleotidyltransferase [Alkalihalophilus pseudofirmus]|nr:CCA tRNA nucleotidyltransferase [Alkalihalophilus pseudofirmus]
MEPLFIIGSKVIQILKHSGHEAYFVGGAVRDYLLQRPVHDIDITTTASVDQIEELFNSTVPIGKEHGTIIVRLEGCSFEVTTFRSVATKERSLIEDLQKRDFTMNAMAMTDEMELVDPFDFRKDLEDKLIRAVGNGNDRFTEDPLRMLRACRLSSQLNFKIEVKTLHSIMQCRDQIGEVAVERVVSEFEKLLTAPMFSLGLHYLLEVELARFIPIFANKERVLRKLSTLKLSTLQSIEEVWTVFLLVDSNEDPVKYLKLLRKSKQFNQQVIHLYQALQTYKRNGWSNELIYDLGLERSLKLVRIVGFLLDAKHFYTEEEIHQWYVELPIQSREDLSINGQSLLQTFQRKQGPWIERFLENAEKAVLTYKVQNNQSEILAWLMKEGDSNDEGEAVGDAVRK